MAENAWPGTVQGSGDGTAVVVELGSAAQGSGAGTAVVVELGTAEPVVVGPGTGHADRAPSACRGSAL
ncbi:MAG: hypothetical protein GY782_05060 [Gammaproteobacteria bacterium]|nr:hypothetical protein [Gammaproteobacteria bacterium]